MADRMDFNSASFSEAMTGDHGAFRLNLTKGNSAIFWLLPKDYAPAAHLAGANHGNVGPFVSRRESCSTAASWTAT